MQTGSVTSWSDAVMTSLAAALAIFLGAIPKVIGFALIVIVGWLIASAVATAVASLLRAVRFNDLARRSGFADFVDKMGIRQDAAGFLANVAKWFIRLIVLVSAFDALGMPAVSQVLQSLLMWLPNLVVALVVLVIAGLAANALASLVRGATAESGLGNPDVLATTARVAVWAFGIVVAVNQIGIAKELVNTLFMATMGGLALALGLAFGLGGRDTAGQIVRGWYERSRQAAPHVAATASRIQLQPQDRADGGGSDTVTSTPPMEVRP
jgi:Conserved TM helix